MLYIVGTPIGNLEDITLRALNTLKEVDVIACEDTRHSMILLKKYEIEKQLISFHSHSGKAKIDKIIDLLIAGKRVALISDAGTPGISDPSFNLINEAYKNNIKIIPIPGACAAITGLMATPLPKDKFIYLGFLPLKKGRQTLFQTFIDEKKTIVFYESPHRINKTIKQLLEVLGEDRIITIAREITKIYEEFFTGTLKEALDFVNHKKIKGEITVILGGKSYAL